MMINKKSTLTPRQRAIYDFIKDKIVRRGYGPTVREIGAGFWVRRGAPLTIWELETTGR